MDAPKQGAEGDDRDRSPQESERDSAEQHGGGAEEVRGRSGEGPERSSPSSAKESVDRHGGGAEEAAETDEVHRRYSEGLEQTPDTPEKDEEGDFAEGMKAHPEGDR